VEAEDKTFPGTWSLHRDSLEHFKRLKYKSSASQERKCSKQQKAESQLVVSDTVWIRSQSVRQVSS